jgi:hypothetical protein
VLAGTSQYLSQYAAPEAKHVDAPIKSARHVLVIPAYQESISNVERAIAAVSDMILVLVVNSPNANDTKTLELLKSIKQRWQRSDESGWFTLADNNQVYVVDRVTRPIEPRQGVGLARKIGADIALQLIAAGHVDEPWIYLSDADAVLPKEYFTSAKQAAHGQPLAFQLYPFQHECEDDVAMALYEFSLLWYALGLQHAGSVYGYPSVGSCITCHASAYAKVRGFPPRAAGEDFYLLNKLRKLGNFAYRETPIRLANRRSQRVPFGTGPALQKIDAMAEPLAWEFYHPGIFVALKQFLQTLLSSYDAKDLTQHFTQPLFKRFAEQQKLLPLLARQQQQKPEVFQKFLIDWFDGFRTLKFVHLAREQCFPSVTFSELWQSEVLPLPCPGERASDIQTASGQIWQRLR